MIKIHNNGIDAAINYMNYKEDGRPKGSLPGTWADGYGLEKPVAYRIHKEGAHLLLQGFLVSSQQGEGSNLTEIDPKAERIASGDVWVGRSSQFWGDYSPNGDGAPRFVAVANAFRDQRYPKFFVDTSNPVWVGVLEIVNDDIVRAFPNT